MMDLDKIPILKSITKYRDSEALPLHMPGHKRGNIYRKLGLDFLGNSFLEYDTTEVPGIDNLHCPESAVAEAQALAAKAFGADYSFFLVNGTTAGIYSMVMAATSPGDEIIIPRNCHRAVLGAVILGRLRPIYINPELDPQLGIAMGINPQVIKEALVNHPKAAAVVLTNPTFYGACSDLQVIADIVHEKGKLLLVDEAHGAHFKFNSRLPQTALDAGADMTAQSIHKTLPSMTQSSILHVRKGRVDIEKLKLYLQLTQTTSPSHILLASIDAARYVMETYGTILLEETIELSQWARDEINKRTGMYCFGEEVLGNYSVVNFDPTRLTINCRKMLMGTELESILRKSFNIQVEMADLYNIVAIITLGDEKSDFIRLVDALEKISVQCNEFRYNHEKTNISYIKGGTSPQISIMPWEAIHCKKEAISIEDSVGRICGEMVIPYPPGIPVLMPGEIIDEDTIAFIRSCKKADIKINGAADASMGRITVIR